MSDATGLRAGGGLLYLSDLFRIIREEGRGFPAVCFRQGPPATWKRLLQLEGNCTALIPGGEGQEGIVARESGSGTSQAV